MNKEENKRTCSICGGGYWGWGHNAEPVNQGRCCDTCNNLVVLPERIKLILKGEK